MKMPCNCPYVICPVYGDCEACIQKNRATGDLAHCMEKRAAELGAKLPLKNPPTYVEEDFEAMSRRSAQLIAEVVRNKPDALLSLAAGSTGVRTFQLLQEMQERGEVDFSQAWFVALDEWLDLADESENCEAFMRKHFYGPLGIPEDHMVLFNVHAQDLDQECKRIDQFIFDRHGIDCMLLGIGMNGHLGLNEPNRTFNSYAKVVELDGVTMQVGQKYFSGGMKLTRGITLGIRHLYESGLVILQVGGSHKREIVKRLYETAPTEELPATVMKLLPHGVVVLDQDAAADIDPAILNAMHP